MDTNKYLPAIEFAIENNDASIVLGKYTYSILHNTNTAEISGDILSRAKKSLILKDLKSIEFSSTEILHFFYLFNFVQNSSEKLQSEEDWVSFLENLNSKSNSTIIEKTGYAIFDIVVLISNRLFNINVPKLIAEKKIKSRMIRTSFWDTLPYLNAETEVLVNALFETTNGINAEDNYINLNLSVRLCSKINPSFGKTLVQKSKASTERLYLFCPFAVGGLTESLGVKPAFPILEVLLRSTDIHQQKAGLRALSMLHGDNDHPQEIEDILSPILEEIEAKNDDALTSDLIFVYGLLINKLSNARQKLKEIPAKYPGRDSFFALSRIIALKIDEEIASEWLAAALQLLSNLSNQHIGTYKQLNWAFYRIIKTHPSVVSQYLEQLIKEESNEIKKIEAFEQVFTELADDNRDLLEEWLTNWFNNDNSRFHIAASKVLSILWVKKERQLKLHEQTINNLTPEDIEFILFKIVGYVHSKEHLESLVYSALSYSKSSEIIEQRVADLYCYYIVYNYPGSIKYLREQKPTANTLQKKVIEIIEQYYEEVHTIRKKKPLELSPSPQRLQLLFNQKTKALGDIMNKSPFKEPSFLDMISKVSLKTGNHFFSRIDDNYGNKKRYSDKSTMGHISQSFEVPGGEFVDPIGQEYNRYIWRMFKRRKQ